MKTDHKLISNLINFTCMYHCTVEFSGHYLHAEVLHDSSMRE